MERYHTHCLRRGRVSLPRHCYLVTVVTQHRKPWFGEFTNARHACRCFFTDSVRMHGDTLAFVVMPDHIHWLIQVEGDLSEAVRIYKARVSLALGMKPWQRGFHDHGLRREEDLRAVARYIIANPLRAGLVNNVLDYPCWDAAWL